MTVNQGDDTIVVTFDMNTQAAIFFTAIYSEHAMGRKVMHRLFIVLIHLIGAFFVFFIVIGACDQCG